MYADIYTRCYTVVTQLRGVFVDPYSQPTIITLILRLLHLWQPARDFLWDLRGAIFSPETLRRIRCSSRGKKWKKTVEGRDSWGKVSEILTGELGD